MGPAVPGLAMVAVMLFSVTPSQGGGVRDLSDGWLCTPAWIGAFIASERPAGAEPGSESSRNTDVGAKGWLAGGVGSLYGMPELPLSSISARFAARGLVWAIDWNRLGSDLFQENVCEFGPLLGCGRGWRFGPVFAVESAVVGRSTFSRSTFTGIVFSGTAPPGLAVDLRMRTAVAPVWHSSRGRYRWASVAGMAGCWGWAVAFDRVQDGPIQLQAALSWRVAEGVCCGLRADPSTGTCGWTTAWRRGSLLLRTSHLAHPDLGVTHRWQCALLLGGSR